MDPDKAWKTVQISIHPPRGGRDRSRSGRPCTCSYFNPPSPWGEGHITILQAKIEEIFQSTLPVGGGTRGGGQPPGDHGDFNPPSPWGEGHDGLESRVAVAHISIHPPRGGRDPGSSMSGRPTLYFNPPSPWGEGQSPGRKTESPYLFQSTLPVGGGTFACLFSFPGL